MSRRIVSLWLRRAVGAGCIVAATLSIAGASEPPAPRIQGRKILSSAFPCARIKVAPPLVFAGRHPFEIAGVAAGERLLFVDAPGKRIRRLWIAQFEAILPSSSEIYRYGFPNAVTLGGIRFRPNTFADSNRKLASEAPAGEAALTAQFLREHGYELPDELMMARFAAVPDPAKRHELLLFYGESLSESGHTLRELYDGENPTPLWTALRGPLQERGLASFEIVPGCS